MANGELYKLGLDEEGNIKDTSHESFGAKTIKLCKISIGGRIGLIRLAAQPGMSYRWEDKEVSCSLPLPPLEVGS